MRQLINRISDYSNIFAFISTPEICFLPSKIPLTKTKRMNNNDNNNIINNNNNNDEDDDNKKLIVINRSEIK